MLRKTLGLGLLLGSAVLQAQTLPSTNFRWTNPITGRNTPTQVAFAHNGQVFVAERAGRVWRYQNLLDTAPVQVLDIAAVVHTIGDRGLLGLALDPRFPEKPYLYVLYSYNGGLFTDTPPRWPASNCPTPPGSTTNGGGCVVSGRLSRFELTGGTVGLETVLIEDWYQQFPSHSIGTVRFGADGYLYVGGGDGASYNFADFGTAAQRNPTWPDLRAPVDQGGALRSQGLEIESLYTGQVWLDGTVVRVDPATGAGAPGNPLADVPGASDNAKRILAYGLRNPYRFTIRPGTSEVWIGDVGWNVWEEINVIPEVGSTPALRNFGWPCFEGRTSLGGYSARPICAALYANNNTGGRTPFAPPFYTYQHVGSSAISGLVFYTGERYPAQYHNALFFTDYNRQRLWVIPDSDNDGLPNAPADSAATEFATSNLNAVDLVSGPGQDIFYVDISGRIRRLSWDADPGNRNLAPSAAIALDAGSLADGPPRTVAFSAQNSVDPDAHALTFTWDLDGDGAFDDATGTTASAAFPTPGVHVVAVRADDGHGGSDIARMSISVVNSAPIVAITEPATPVPWASGDTITLAGAAEDPEQGPLPGSALQWQMFLARCTNPDYTGCTEEPLASASGATASVVAPDVAFPAYLRVVLAAVDNGGLAGSDELLLYPAVVDVTLASLPAGLSLSIGNEAAQPAPFTRRQIVNAGFTVAAASPQWLNDVEYVFAAWSDAGAASHVARVATPGAATLTASYASTADLALSVDNGVDNVDNGATVTWLVVVNNHGAGRVNAARLRVNTPAALENVSWTCTASSGGTCGSGGSGAPDDLADVPAGGTASYAVTGTVASSATGVLSVSATVTPPPGAVNQSPLDDSASDTDPIGDLIFRNGFD